MAHRRKLKVAITGASGQVGYGLIFRIASGEVFGRDTQIDLQLLEHKTPLRGIAMELADCAFSCLTSIAIASSLDIAFSDADWVFLAGTPPVMKNLPRKDRLLRAALVIKQQAASINRSAKADVRVIVIGNPCNTNCLVGISNAPDTRSDNWFALTMLDQTRAVGMIAEKAGVPVDSVRNLRVWGNHPTTIFPDYFNARIKGVPVSEVVSDKKWLESEFVERLRTRYREIIEARGHSSAASAIEAVVRTTRAILVSDGRSFSAAVLSKGQYNVPSDIVFGFPVSSVADRVIVNESHDVSEFVETRLTEAINELRQEREIVKSAIS